ncbi:hypothetical protein F1654_00500 [Alkalicaulis satelles]|uniref:Uncharacterized protein n=1 Tax=Alkalicaulis satelles TaxID=2609175 RepID=A0A5M6ZLA2_9PROT|nr:hypothetical protein [Alkalicaulis satelles]KAA5804524.1 hypothetical protein F1654_00500 [Alkalicaulis satelles]
MGDRLAAAAVWMSARLRIAALAVLAVIAIRAGAGLASTPEPAVAPASGTPASSLIQGRPDRGGQDANPEMEDGPASARQT